MAELAREHDEEQTHAAVTEREREARPARTAPLDVLQRAAGNQAVLHAVNNLDRVPPAIRTLLAHDRGQPLDLATRARMEASFGRGFGQVRVHAGTEAAETVRGVGARAYTVGDDIAFGHGRYAPDTSEGQSLLAHELAHVVQQGRGGPAGPDPSADGATEQAAHSAAHEVAVGGPAQVAGATGVGLARAPDPAAGVPTLTIQRVEIRPNAIVVYTDHGFCAFTGTYTFTGKAPDPAGYPITATLVPRAAPEERASGGAGVAHATASTSDGRNSPAAVVQPAASGAAGKGGFTLVTEAPDDVKAKMKAVVPTGRGEGVWSALPNQFVLDTRPRQITLRIIAEPFGGAGGGQKQGAGSGRPAPKLKFGKAPKAGDRPGKQDEQREESDEGTEGGDARIRILPAYPAELLGPEVQAIGGTGEYEMNLRTGFMAGSSMLNQAIDASHGAEYTWQVFRMGRGTRDVSRTEQGVQGFAHKTSQIERERASNQEDRSRNWREGNYGNYAANVAADELEDVSSLVKYVGAAVDLAADATSNRDYIRGIAWPAEEGTYIVRVTAQPNDRPQSDGTILRFKPSFGWKIVEVKKPSDIAEADLAKAGYELDKAGVELAEAKAALAFATDPEQRKRIQESIDSLEAISSGKSIETLRESLKQLHKQIADAKGDPMSTKRLKEKKAELEELIDQAMDRQKSMAGETVVVQAILTSHITGSSHPLLLQLRLEKVPTGDASKEQTFRARLSDITSRSGKLYEPADGQTPGQAIWNAVSALASNNDYGPGILSVRVLTARPGGVPLTENVRSFQNIQHDLALARSRLRDLATVVGTVAIFVPGLGQAALVLGAAVAADRLIDRYRHDTLQVDPESIGDVLSILSAFAAGASSVGRLVKVHAGNSVIIQIGRGVERGGHAAGSALGKAMLFAVSNDMMLKLKKINQDEASGDLSPLEARRQRAHLLSALAQTLGQEISAARMRHQAAQARPPSSAAPMPASRKSAPTGKAVRTPRERTPVTRETAPRPGAERRAAEMERGVPELDRKAPTIEPWQQKVPEIDRSTPEIDRTRPEVDGAAPASEPELASVGAPKAATESATTAAEPEQQLETVDAAPASSAQAESGGGQTDRTTASADSSKPTTTTTPATQTTASGGSAGGGAGGPTRRGSGGGAGGGSGGSGSGGGRGRGPRRPAPTTDPKAVADQVEAQGRATRSRESRATAREIEKQQIAEDVEGGIRRPTTEMLDRDIGTDNLTDLATGEGSLTDAGAQVHHKTGLAEAPEWGTTPENLEALGKEAHAKGAHGRNYNEQRGGQAANPSFDEEVPLQTVPERGQPALSPGEIERAADAEAVQQWHEQQNRTDEGHPDAIPSSREAAPASEPGASELSGEERARQEQAAIDAGLLRSYGNQRRWGDAATDLRERVEEANTPSSAPKARGARVPATSEAGTVPPRPDTAAEPSEGPAPGPASPGPSPTEPAPTAPAQSQATAPAVTWEELSALAERPAKRATAGGFRSQSARMGTREVVIVEGPLGDKIPPEESLAGYTPKLPGEDASHSVGMQSGENLPEGITSAPERFNLSQLKVFENTLRATGEAAQIEGAQVDTRTVVRIEHVTRGGKEVPVMVGVEREGVVRLPGSDNTHLFAQFRARIDPVTRRVTVERNWQRRPRTREPGAIQPKKPPRDIR